MASSPTISLFSARPELNQQPYIFLVSMLVHGAVIGLLFFGILSAPRVRTPSAADRYNMRRLDLHTLDTEIERAAASAAKSLDKHPLKHPSSAGGSRQAQQPLMRQVAQAMPARQTLIQPDIVKPVQLAVEIPVPTVVLWNAAKTPAKTLVAPLPQKPPVSTVKPSLQKPNEEPNLADIAIPAADRPSLIKTVLPSTTTPVVLQGPKPTPPAPVTTAAGAAQPTAAAVMSLSDTRMANGAVVLPPVNETAQSSSSGALAPGQAKDPSQPGHGNPDSKTGGAGTGQAPAETSNPQSPAGDLQGGDNQAAQTGSGLGNQPSVTHITRQKEGQFGSVIVGSSLEEEYPETAEQWSGRVAYTVYVPVGLAKSWILQYSLSRDENAAAAGNIAHIDAPWPYNIVRPNIDPGSVDADALMIHGFVNLAGRFEALAIVFPPSFPQAQFVLNSLAQWQFRPAMQNGQNVKVEVLLIIPEEPE